MKRLVFTAIAVFFSFIVSPPALALLGVGNLVSDYAQYQKNRKAERRRFEYSPYVSGHYRLSLTNDFEFIPELSFAFHKRPSPNHSRMTISLLYPLLWKMWSNHYLIGGFGNMVTRVAGKGGTVVMSNGTGVSSFARPSGATYSQAITALIGYEYRFRKYLSFRMNVFVLPVLAKNPSMAYTMSTNLYYF